MAGLWFEQFSDGQAFEHGPTRTVTEMDNVLFSTLTMNPQPLHLDEEFAASTEFGQRIVNSLFTLGLRGRADGGRDDARHHHRQSRHEPTWSSRSRCSTATRSARARKCSRAARSRSRPDAGIVEFEHQAINQRGEVVAICVRAAFMRCRPT